MIQFDADIELSIIIRLYEESFKKVMKDLDSRKQKVKWMYDNLSGHNLQKAHLENEHIITTAEHLRNSDTLIQKLIDLLVNRRGNQIDWRQEHERECEKNLEFVKMMMHKYHKLKKDEDI